MLIQGFLARKKTGMDIGTSGIFGIHSILNSIKVIGKVIPIRLESPPFELDNTYIHSCTAVLRGSFQLLQKRKRIFHYRRICRRRAIKYENDIAVEIVTVDSLFSFNAVATLE